MNREDAKLYVRNYEAIKAYAEGKEIQFRMGPGAPWRTNEAEYNFRSGVAEYRVKPAPKTIYAVARNSGMTVCRVSTREEAESKKKYFDAGHHDYAPYIIEEYVQVLPKE